MAARKKAASKRPVEHGGRYASAFDIFSDSIRTTFDLNIFIAPLMAIVFGIIAIIATLVLSVPFIIAGALFSAAGTAAVAPMIALIAIGILIFSAIIVVSSAIISGFYYKSVDEYISGKKISIEKNIKFAIAEWKRLVAIYLIKLLICLVIAALVMAPAVLFVISALAISGNEITAAISSESTTELITALGPVFVVLGAVLALLIAIMFFINPLLFLWFPTAVFEKKPAMECVKKGYYEGKAKYKRNLAAIFLMGLIGCVVGIFSMFNPTYIIGIILGIWLELASIVMIIKIYREGA
ncbi:MAG: hypothetical protein WC634_04505 [archaeon]